MTYTEFKNEFLLEYDSHGSNRAPALTNYHISYWLTRGQRDLVKDYLTPKSNRRQEGFEKTETRRKKLSHLVRPLTLTTTVTYDPDVNIQPGSDIYDVHGHRIMEIKEEHLEVSADDCDGRTQLKVSPITHDDYTELLRNPFRAPSKWTAWRLDLGTGQRQVDSGPPKEYLEIISSIPYTAYKLRYVMRPFPIIVGDLTLLGPDFKIEGEAAPRTSDLHESLHDEIVTRAVTLALETVSDPRFQTHMVMESTQIE